MFQSLSIVLPAYNEQDNIEAAVRTAVGAAAAAAPDHEVVVVDDGSRDATPERVAALAEARDGRGRVLLDAVT